MVVYNNTTSADTYGSSIAIAAKSAHVFVNGSCIMDGVNPKSFTIPGFDLATFRVAPIATSGNTAIIDDVKIYNSLPTAGSGDPIAVTGVTLKSATTLTVGDSEKLVATVTPNDATDKAVSWESNNEDVATVDDEGNVTAVGLGTARITVTTHDGDFTADCDVTVVPVAATIDFTSNVGWNFPTEKTIPENSYTNDGYTIKLQGSEGNGYMFDSGNLMIGKNGAKLTLPAFPFNVSKIKVYGSDGASASVTFNVFVGDDAVSTEVTSSKVAHEFAILAEKQEAGNVYVIKVTNGNNMRITKIKIFGYTTITPGKIYTTLTSANNLDFTNVSDDLKAYIATEISGGYVQMTQVNKVPAGTGLVLKATTPGSAVNVPVFDGTGADDVDGNKMKGSATETTYVGENAGYILSNGVFQPSSGGDLPAGKAYLNIAVTGSAPVLNLGFSDGDATGIDEVRSQMEEVREGIFDLSGRRVENPTKGIYIVNGKKVIIK